MAAAAAAAPQKAAPSFLQLPVEIRLHIYRELLLAPVTVIEPERNLVSIPDYHVYEPKEPRRSNAADDDNNDDDDDDDDGDDDATARPNYTLSFRNSTVPKTAAAAAATANEDDNNAASVVRQRQRSRYKIRSGRFRNHCIDATYICLNPPAGISTTFMQTSRQVHEEAARVLYTAYTFDFDTNFEACVPFLLDLTPVARACLRRIGVVKRALPYDKDFDRCEWENMCECIASTLSLASLSLGVVAGKPMMGWDDEKKVPRFSKDEFVEIAQRDDMQWVRDLQLIKGLRRLDIRACVEHCPAPTSNAMAFFVSLSASVEFGLREYLLETMKIPSR